MGFFGGLLKGDSNSSNKQKFVKMGTEYYKAKDWEKALENFTKASEIDSNDWEQLVNIGCCLRNLNRANESLVLYDRAIQINPSSGIIYQNQAAALLSLHRYDETLVALNTAKKFGEESGEMQMHRSICLAKLGNSENAVQLIDELIKKFPSLGSLVYVKAKILMNGGNIDEANNCFIKSDTISKNLGIQPKDWDTFKNQINSLF